MLISDVGLLYAVAGKSKCKGKINTFKIQLYSLACLYSCRNWGGQRLGKCKTGFLADFLFTAWGSAVAKISASRRVRVFAIAGPKGWTKNVTKIWVQLFSAFVHRRVGFHFFGMCF